MGVVTSLADSYNLPQYVGDLFGITPKDTPLLSAIGGLTGGKDAQNTEFAWQTYDNKSRSVPSNLEGADPSKEARTRSEVKNCVQIFQEGVKLSYSKMGATQRQNNTAAVQGMIMPPSELDFQIEQKLIEIAGQIEYTFFRGVYAMPANNASARQMNGILNAITTNAVNAGGGQLTESGFLDLLQQIWQNGGIKQSELATVFCGAYQKRKLSKIFELEQSEQNRNARIANISLQQIETDFGAVNLVLSRDIPADELVVCSLDVMAPVFMEVEDKGFMFAEPLAKTGAAETWQVYGEVGLEYGWEGQHGKITNLATS